MNQKINMILPHKDTQKSIEMMSELLEAQQGAFSHIYSKKNLISNDINYPNNSEATKEIQQGVHSLLNGSLLVYLFAIWDKYTPEKIDEWLEESEARKLKAFKHVRHSVAHGHKGNRAKGCRKEFEAEMPFSGISWDREADKIDISHSSVPWDCFQFMQKVNQQLVIRLYSNRKPGESI